MSNKRFMYILRQLAAMENRTGKDYSEQVLTLAQGRADTMMEEGVPYEEARLSINTILNNERLRYPVELQEVQEAPIS